MIRSSKYFFRLILSLGTLLPGEATAWSCPQQTDTPVPAVAEKNDGSPWHDLNLKFAGAQVVRARFRVKDEILFLQLPMPGEPRPDTDDSEAKGLRKMALRRVGKPGAKELEGVWKVFQSTLDGKEAVQFHGDELTFSKDTVEVHEHQSDQRYVAEFELPDKSRSVPDGTMTPAELLEEKFGADLERDSAGVVISVTLLGRRRVDSISRFTPEHAEALKQFPDLQTLVIADHEFLKAEEDLKFLESLTKLRKLDLRKTNVNDAAMHTVGLLRSLRILKLEYSSLVTDDIEQSLSNLTSLEELDLAFVPVGDSLAKSVSRLPGLKRLYLYGTNVSDAGVNELSRMQTLEVLYVGCDEGAAITDQCLSGLKRLSRLKVLGIPGTRISDAGVRDLQEALPGCQLSGVENRILDSAKPVMRLADGTAEGVLTFNGVKYHFQHACCWRVMDETDSLHILLTEKPADLRELELSYARYSNDFTFEPFQNQIRMVVDKGDIVKSIHLVADGKSVDVTGEGTSIKTNGPDGKLSGQVRSLTPGGKSGHSWTFDARFSADTELISSSPKKP